MRRVLAAFGAVLGAIIVGVALVVWFGIIDVAADAPHSAPVFSLLKTVRERSIAVRSRDIEAPDLSDPAAIRRGAGNYDSMCAGCHLAPGMSENELTLGLYPTPPNFARTAPSNPAGAFWAIKHGIKATGMPAWGKHMDDRSIWDMVAFLVQLPTLTAEQYASQVSASDGHSHGQGGTKHQSHESID